MNTEISKTIICRSALEFETFIAIYGKGNRVGYDVETNARPLYSNDHEVIGFSLAYDSEIGCYVPLKALDFQMSDNDRRSIEKRTKSILLDNNIMVYNCLHEYPATLTWLDLYLPNVTDVFVKALIMTSSAEKFNGRKGLKRLATVNCNITNWSEDLEEYFDLLHKFPESEDNLKKFLNRFYSEEEIPHLIDLILQIPQTEFSRTTMSYEYVPYKVIGTYGATDSTVLFRLDDYYNTVMQEASKKFSIDLFKGFEYWMKHQYAAFTLERNGAYWNDEIATKVENWCKQGILTSFRYLLKSKLSRPYIETKIKDAYLSFLMNNHAYILSPEYIPIRTTKNTITVSPTTEQSEKLLIAMSLVAKIRKKDGQKTYALQIGNFETILKHKRLAGFDDSQIYEDFFNTYLIENIPTSYNVENLEKIKKRVLNPGATVPTFYAFVSDILVTDNIRLAKLYNDFVALIDSPNFDVDMFKNFYDLRSERIDNSPKFTKGFKIKEFKKANPQYLYQDTEDSKFLEQIIKLQALDSKVKFRLFQKILEKYSSSLHNYRLLKIISDTSNFKLESCDDESLINLFNLYEFTGIDIEDKNTWNENFAWLYYFRWYKKYSKVLSTYIYGIVGRKSVWLVPKDQFESKQFAKRSYEYYSPEGERIRNTPSELAKYDMVFQSYFKANRADSGRWTATMHTIPSGTTLKGIFTSRYKGGVVAMPDCSQAEVRVLAAVSQDKNLLEYFRSDGGDIHKFVASLIYNLPIDQVSKIQRKVAKSAVFGILYGESEQSFADAHFKGDLSEAQKVFQYFYTAFPTIKNYVDLSHSQYDKYQATILSLTDRFLDLSKSADSHDPDKVYRISQNGPIQGSTADLAGLILFTICNFIETNNMYSKPFCFIHDSIEIDLHPDETFRMLDALRPIFNEFPEKEFGVPMASDIVFSVNMGAEIDVKKLEHDEEYNDVWITLEGFASDIQAVLDQWNSVYDLVELDKDFETKELSTEYIPLRGLFMEKVVISPEMGTTKTKILTRYHIVRNLATKE